MTTPRLGGLALEPIPFSSKWIPEEAKPSYRDLLEKRATSLQVFRFFYESGPNRVEGFLVEPVGSERRPCIIYNRGGSENFGSISEDFCWVSRMAYFADAGYSVIASQYSGCGQSTGKDDFGGEQTLSDVMRLFDLIQADPLMDEVRVGMFGGSRGGMMVYQLLPRAPWLRAAVTMAGSGSLLDASFCPKMQEVYQRLFGSAPEEYEKRSVLSWVHRLPKDVPLLILHGSADWRVNPLDSLELTRRCYEERIPCRLVWYPGGDHSLSEYYNESVRETIQWFHTYVRDQRPLPVLEPHGK